MRPASRRLFEKCKICNCVRFTWKTHTTTHRDVKRVREREHAARTIEIRQENARVAPRRAFMRVDVHTNDELVIVINQLRVNRGAEHITYKQLQKFTRK